MCSMPCAVHVYTLQVCTICTPIDIYTHAIIILIYFNAIILSIFYDGTFKLTFFMVELYYKWSGIIV